MNIKKRSLMPGWYPDDKMECENQIKRFLENSPPLELANNTKVYGGIVPHAGWYYSGKLAVQTIATMKNHNDADLIVLVGGHLSPKSPTVLFEFDGFETPFGTIDVDLELLNNLKDVLPKLSILMDEHTDNTTEMQLPIIKYFYPSAKIIVLRTPPSQNAIDVGKLIGDYLRSHNRSALFIGSTDLTHYGTNYMFSPRGKGQPALEWVKNVNDATFIKNIENFTSLDALSHANTSHSACSAGASVTVMEASKVFGATKTSIVDYYTSHDVEPSTSFVGYVGIAFTS